MLVAEATSSPCLNITSLENVVSSENVHVPEIVSSAAFSALEDIAVEILSNSVSISEPRTFLLALPAGSPSLAE